MTLFQRLSSCSARYRKWARGMAQMLRIDNVIDDETYTDRHGIIHPNRIEGRSIYFVNRVEDLFLNFVSKYAHAPEEINAQFIGPYKIINDILVEYPREIYKDSNLRNLIWNNYGNIVAIDFERLTLMPPQIELVKLLEDDMTDYITEKERNSLIDE